MSKNHDFPHGLPQSNQDIKVYEDCDYLIHAYEYEGSDSFSLEIGTEILFEADLMSDKQIIDRAKQDMIIEKDEEDFKLGNGEWDIENLRDFIRTSQLESPISPSSRARYLFEPIINTLPTNIIMTIENSHSMGNDRMWIIVEGIESIKNLQIAMEQEGIKINFIIERF